jgi:hypothetical protein
VSLVLWQRHVMDRAWRRPVLLLLLRLLLLGRLGHGRGLGAMTRLLGRRAVRLGVGVLMLLLLLLGWLLG